jgi:hypothetical protein
MMVNAQPIGEPSASKTWSVAAILRGFYDDNYTTGVNHPTPGGRPGKDESWGIDVRPSAAFNYIQDTTTVNVRVDYSLRWYEARDDNEYDQTIVANAQMTHDIDETFRVEARDQFAYSDEPGVMEPGVATTFYRTDATNWRNYAGATALKDFSDTIGMGFNYSGRIYDYQEDGSGSRSALLDRFENKFSVDGRYHFQPTFTGLVGYQFGFTDMTSDDLLASPGAIGIPPGAIKKADYRNRRSHYGYVGVNYDMSEKLSTQARAGMQYANYYNVDQGDNDYLGPYVEWALSYWYMEACRVMLGVTSGIYPTDLGMANGSSGVTLGSQSTMVYVGISHQIMSHLTAYVRGSWQGSKYQGGPYDDERDNYWTADVNLTYDLNTYAAVEVGYLYDDLDSNILQRGYTRNRCYFGIRATY